MPLRPETMLCSASQGNFQVPVCAAGVRSSAQAVVAMGLGAQSLILREPLAGSSEAPGALHHGHGLVTSTAVRYGSSRAWERQQTVPRSVAQEVSHKGQAPKRDALQRISMDFSSFSIRNMMKLVILDILSFDFSRFWQVKAFLLYFMSGLRRGLRELGYQSLSELHMGLEKELLRMECRPPYGIQHREACSQAAPSHSSLRSTKIF